MEGKVDRDVSDALAARASNARRRAMKPLIEAWKQPLINVSLVQYRHPCTGTGNTDSSVSDTR